MGTTTGKDSIFAKWRTAMGMGAKQVSEAGALLGLPTPAASRRNRGLVESDLMERLAMAAVRAGLPPWSPKADGEIVAAAHAVALVRHAAENPVKSAGRLR
jgi:hypothetical protein